MRVVVRIRASHRSARYETDMEQVPRVGEVIKLPAIRNLGSTGPLWYTTKEDGLRRVLTVVWYIDAAEHYVVVTVAKGRVRPAEVGA